MALRLRSATLTVAALLLLPADAFKYSLEQHAPYDGYGTQLGLLLSEGGMYASHDGPFGTDGISEILIEGTLTATPASGVQVASSNLVNLWTAVVDETTKESIGRLREVSSGSYAVDYCCTPVLFSEGLCGPGVRPGGLIMYPDLFPAGTTSLPVNVTAISVPEPPAEGPVPSTGVTFTAYYEVQRKQWQFVVLAVCDASGAVLPLPTLDITMDATFLNPYGYLPGPIYGLMPFYGVLLVAYVLVAVHFGVLGFLRRRYLILLQYCVFGVLLIGIIEAAAFHGMYKEKNGSGVPTPCSDCGPPGSNYLAAVSLAVFKRAFSRALLLAVALGFGVVHRRLTRSQTLSIIGLSLAYLVCGLANDLKRSTTYDVGPSQWELPLIMLDATFLVWIFCGLATLRQQLQLAGQAAKLQMYNRLYWVLIANIVAWFFVTLASLLVRRRVVNLPWTAQFLFTTFWDLLYLFVTIAVAIIWAPGESSYQYSYYSQAPGAGAGGVADAVPDSADLEAAGPGGGTGESAVTGGPGGLAAAGDDDGDVELTTTGTGTGRKSGRAAGGATAPARHDREATGTGTGSSADGGDGDSDLGDSDLGDDGGEIEISLTPAKGAAGTATASGSAAAAGGGRRAASAAASSSSAAGENFAIDEEADDEESGGGGGSGDRRKLTIQAGPGVDARPLRPVAEAPAPASARTAAPASAAAAPASGGKGLLAPPRAFAPTAADASASASAPAGAAATPASVPGAATRAAKPATAASTQKPAASVDDLDLDDFD